MCLAAHAGVGYWIRPGDRARDAVGQSGASPKLWCLAPIGNPDRLSVTACCVESRSALSFDHMNPCPIRQFVMYRATRLGQARTSWRKAVEEATAVDMSGLLPHAAAWGSLAGATVLGPRVGCSSGQPVSPSPVAAALPH
jgi:hypothetical protein